MKLRRRIDKGRGGLVELLRLAGFDRDTGQGDAALRDQAALADLAAQGERFAVALAGRSDVSTVEKHVAEREEARGDAGLFAALPTDRQGFVEMAGGGGEVAESVLRHGEADERHGDPLLAPLLALEQQCPRVRGDRAVEVAEAVAHIAQIAE